MGKKRRNDKEPRQEFASRVINYYETKSNFSSYKTVKHFELEGKLKSVIYRILKRYNERGTATYRKPCGKPRTVSTPKNVQKIRELLEQDPTMSIQQLALETGLSQGTVGKIKIKDLGLRTMTKGGGDNGKTPPPENFEKKVKVLQQEEVVEAEVPSQHSMDIDREERLQGPPVEVEDYQFPAKVGLSAFENLQRQSLEEGDPVWRDFDESLEDAASTSNRGGCSPERDSQFSAVKGPLEDIQLKSKRTSNYVIPPISKTCILCRGKLNKQLKINYKKDTGRYKALCLESLSMLFALPANHSLITVFANTTPTTMNNSDDKERFRRTPGKLCDRCLQDITNVQFVFWQLQNLERKLSELQKMIYDRLRVNYEELPDDTIFGRFIGVDELKRDLQSLNYDDIVKIIFEEIKSTKDNWPKFSHTTRWIEACKHSEQIADLFLQSVEEEEDPQDDNDAHNLSPPPSPYFSSSPPPSPPVAINPPIKVEVDPFDDNAHSDNSLLKFENEPIPKPTPKTKKRLKKTRKIKTEPDADKHSDHRLLRETKNPSDNDGDKIHEKKSVKKTSNMKIGKTRTKRTLPLPRIKTKKGYRFPCTEDPTDCNKTFGSGKLLLNHIEKHHKNKKFACDQPGCSGKFKSEGILSRHRELVHGIHRPKIICELCGIDVDSREMSEHIFLKHRGNGNFKCDRCSMDFTDFQEFKNHQQLHDEHVFTCVTCNKPFQNWNDLQAHLKTNHLLNNGVICNICGARKPNQVLLQRHLKIHNRPKLVCPICGKGFGSANYLKYHEDYYHRNPGQKFYCEICGKVFMHAKNLRSHRSTHHSTASVTAGGNQDGV